MEDTFEKIKRIITTVCGIEEISEEANLYEDLEVDSLAALEIVCEIEKEWRISLADYPELLDEMETIETLVPFLKKLGGEL